MIKLEKKYVTMIKRILTEQSPDCEVRLFGSRTNSKAVKYSDIDIALVGKRKLNWRLIEKIKLAFSESDIPYMVDVVDWHAISPEFRKVIEKKFEVL